VSQSQLLGALPAQLLIAAGTAGIGEAAAAAGVTERIGQAITQLADVLRTTDVQFPVILGADGTASAFGVGAVKGVRSPFVRDGGVYVLRDPETGDVVRTGRTNNLGGRERQHLRDPILGQFDFDAVYTTNDYATQRGLENYVYKLYPNAPYNYIRPISPTNKNITTYVIAATDYLNRLGK